MKSFIPFFNDVREIFNAIKYSRNPTQQSLENLKKLHDNLYTVIGGATFIKDSREAFLMGTLILMCFCGVINQQNCSKVEGLLSEFMKKIAELDGGKHTLQTHLSPYFPTQESLGEWKVYELPKCLKDKFLTSNSSNVMANPIISGDFDLNGHVEVLMRRRSGSDDRVRVNNIVAKVSSFDDEMRMFFDRVRELSSIVEKKLYHPIDPNINELIGFTKFAQRRGTNKKQILARIQQLEREYTKISEEREYWFDLRKFRTRILYLFQQILNFESIIMTP